MKVNWTYVLIGAVVLYFVWRYFIKKKETVVVTPSVAPSIIIPEEVKTQGDIVNELAFARG